MTGVAVLFARSDSIYKAMPGLDVFDIERDARTYRGASPVVAHPPCRAWGRLRKFAKPRDDEKALAIFAVDQVRRCGGVLEHPECSSLWDECALPLPGKGADEFGGWTWPLDQFWFGHRARKRTWLYIVGVKPADMPLMPLRFGNPSHVVKCSDNERRKALGLKIMSKAEREHSPRDFAAWLVDVASRCQVRACS